jgi:hypothetical protein
MNHASGEHSMKLAHRLAVTTIIISLFTLSAAPTPAFSQQAAATSVTVPKPVIEEWVYRTKYGYRDEWWALFKKYQIAILERQKQLGYVKDSPSAHPAFLPAKPRVGITASSSLVPQPMRPQASLKARSRNNSSLTRTPSNAKKNRRWEFTTNHWDLPIHVVNLDASN